MKIYILRHEDRNMDATFFSPLTEKGLTRSQNLINDLNKLNITKIYCSPYIRTMQTILPYSKASNNKLNLDYSLVEIQHPGIIPPYSVNLELPQYIANKFNYNPDYNSLIKPTDIIYPENECYLEIRTKKFIKNIILKYHKTDNNILIVTHQGLCKIMLKIINKYGNIKPSNELIKEYPTGIISLIFENNYWIYKKIN